MNRTDPNRTEKNRTEIYIYPNGTFKPKPKRSEQNRFSECPRLLKRMLIYASDYVIMSKCIKMMEALRERYFGPTFELKSHEKYKEIWDLDEKDPFKRPEGGESVDDVVSRLVSAIESIEADYQRCAILVVSHGDPLQMLQNVFHSAVKESGDGFVERFQKTKVASVLSKHRKFALLTGELRPLL